MAGFTVPRTWVSGSVTSAQMNTMRDNILELQAAVTNDGFGAIQVSSPASGPQSIAYQAWIAPGIAGVDYLYGNGVGRTTAGVQCANIGRYQVRAKATWNASGTGRRLIGVDVAGLGSAGPSQVRWDYPGAPSSSTFMTNATGEVTTTVANQVITIYLYQESGGALNILDRQLLVRRMS